jgi:hypothetical protein
MNELPVASGRKLLASTAIAALVAGAILTVVVLPAEYGIDPTGIGARLGIRGMSVAADDAVGEEDLSAIAEASSATTTPPVTVGVSELNAVWRQAAPYRSDQLSVTLAPNDGAEIKAAMRAGERLVFTWTAEGGVVNFDMHGDAVDAKNGEFTSYWKGRAAHEGHGAFIAPFDGVHGWYWRNRGTQPVTVTVKTSGFYEKLYRP